MTRSQRDEYDKKITGALRKYLAEEVLTEDADTAGAQAEVPAGSSAWLATPLSRTKRKQFFRSLGRAAAVVLLVLIVGFGAVCAASSEVRAAVGNTWNQIYARWSGDWKELEPGPDEVRTPNFFQRASYTDEASGWYYTIIFTGYPGVNDPYAATFVGIDLRHRFAENSWSEGYQTGFDLNGERYYQINRLRSQFIFFGSSEAEKRDRRLIDEILKKILDPSTNGGEPDPADYAFEALDKEMFFDLLKQTLVDAPVMTGDKKHGAMSPIGTYVEPEWQDGYRFQIIGAERTEGIDEVYIDVLYRTGDAYDDYVQLSDLAEAGKADAAQQELFSLLQEVRAAIKEKNSFTAMEAALSEKKIEGIDFGRLNCFLQALEEGNAEKYHEDPSVLPWETVTISKEEWDEHMREQGLEE